MDIRLKWVLGVAWCVVAELAALTTGTSACAAAADDQVLVQNKTLVRRVYEEGLSRGQFNVPYTPDFVGHGGNRNFDHAAGMAEAKGFRTAFPDLEARVDLILAEADLVSVRWTARGTNTGAAMGIPATGKPVQISGTTVFRIRDGAIAEEWTSGDNLGLLRQLGLLPTEFKMPAAQPATQR